MRVRQWESGRTLTELLGVLAIVGVLTIIGIVGYRYAITKHETNKVLNAGRVLVFLCSPQRQSGNGNTCANVVAETNLQESFSIHIPDPARFQVRALHLNKNVCDQLTNSSYSFAISTQINADGVCLDNDQNAITWTFANDLGGYTGGAGGEGGDGGDGGGCPPCRSCETCDGATQTCVENCPAGQSCLPNGSCGAPANCNNACNLCQSCNTATNQCVSTCSGNDVCAIDYDQLSTTYGKRICCPAEDVLGEYCYASINAQGQCCRAADQTKCCPSDKPIAMGNFSDGSGAQTCYSCNQASPFYVVHNPNDCETVCAGQRYLNPSDKKCALCPATRGQFILTQAQCETCSACVWEDKGAGNKCFCNWTCSGDMPLTMGNFGDGSGAQTCYSCNQASPFYVVHNPNDCEGICPGVRYLDGTLCRLCPANKSALTQARCAACNGTWNGSTCS